MARRRNARDVEMNDESSGSDGNDGDYAEANNEAENHGQDDAGPPAAAAAAARPAENSLLEQLMERIRIFLSSVGADAEAEIDEDQALRLLEASAGDLDVVTSLYCDHYFATLGSRRSPRRPAPDDEEESLRRVRRRLEDELEQHADDNANHDLEEEEEEEEVNNDNPPAENPEAPAEMPPPAQPVAEARIAALDRRAGNNEEGHAVSDDEDPLRPSRSSRRRVRVQRQGQDEPNIPGIAPILRNISEMDRDDDDDEEEAEYEQNHEAVAPLRQDQVSVKKEEEDDDFDDDIDENFLCDNDWIFRDDADSSPVNAPEILLWGNLLFPQESASTAGDGNAANAPSVVGEGANNAPHVAEGAGNVVAEDDDDDGDGAAPSASPKEGIPKTWIHAGFSASSCGTGLVTKPPEDDEHSIYRWRQSQSSGLRNIAPPPYHCRGVTALLSIVTSLIYSGASIQGSTVDCKKSRTPFAELSESDRQREFDSRLVDALSSLLLVAAKASLERKKRALAKRKLASPPGTGDDDKLRQQNLERKLGLVPTCRFEDNTGTGDGSYAEGELVQIATSFTSMQDIRSYVMSTMRSFTKKGGCALFLETIIRIHGKACVERMVRVARRKARLPPIDVLIECECEKRQKKLQALPFHTLGTLNGLGEKANGPIEKALPLDHSCITTELVSLLLTGEVHSTFKGWDAGSLGIGILSMTPGEVGRQLMRPQKPVWILRGETCFSVIWLDGKHEHAESVSRDDRPATDAFRLSHWNAWFGDRHKSGMRVITARGEWSPPVFSKVKVTAEKKTVTDSIMTRRKEQSNNVSSDEHGEDDKSNAMHDVTKEDIDHVKVHPDDVKLFPDNHRQWRFDIGKTTFSSNGEVKAEDDVKMGPVSSGREHWTPYFRLDDRERTIVEMKVSPMIKRILWTRWPGATIDRFTPEGEADPTPPVV